MTELHQSKTSPHQKLTAISADVTDYDSFEAAARDAETRIGPISTLFCCAGICWLLVRVLSSHCSGSSRPGFFVDQHVKDFVEGMNVNYFGAVNAIKVACICSHTFLRV